MYQRILVPLDESKSAERVIPYARLLHRSFGAPIELLRVIEAPSVVTGDPAYNAYLDRVTEALEHESKRYLEEMAEGLRASGTPVTWSVLRGDPPTTIKSEAERRPNTLVAMCTHGRSGHSRWWLGSTADKVCHATANPLLLLRDAEAEGVTAEARITRCVVPLDGSTMAEQILPHAAACCRALRLPLTLVRVVPEVDSHYWELFPDDYSPNLEGQAREYLEGIHRGLAEQGLNDVSLQVLTGHPANLLAELAREDSQTLIALMTHGLGSSEVFRWTLGSVAQRVVGHALGPALLIRAHSDKTD
jgi:nucleotide-binding universal stress UspA family protein